MLIIGLTGSIATGKSETSRLFSDAHIPVFDADEEVHRIYQKKAVVDLMGRHFPGALTKGEIDRSKLAQIVLHDTEQLKLLESLIHPLVRAERQKFIAAWKAKAVDFIVMDIPLLFETKQNEEMDYVLVVTAPENTQRIRALSRAGMTDEKFNAIKLRQVPDAEKRKRADFVIENSETLEDLRLKVHAVIETLKELSRKAVA